MLEIRHLKLVKTIAETRNLTKAANVLYLTQSALSHQLRELREMYQSKIFRRINREMIPTSVGERLIEMAHKVLCEIECGDMQIKSMLAESAGVIRISTQCYTFYHWLSPIISRYATSFPDVEIKIVGEATYDTLNFLEEHKLDLAILNFKPKNTHLHLTELFEDEMSLIVSPQHPLAQKSYVIPADLVDEHYLTYSLPNGYGKTFEQLFKKNHLFPRKISSIQLTEAIIEMVKSNLGVAVMANWAIGPHLNPEKLVKVKIGEKGMRRKWYGATLKSEKRPVYLEKFIQTIVECKR